ncbi:efflux RND transporter periplasmic adaptor subunit [Evansella tamaricis]|uniref:Efflux RND transporter periplasmic adaptor subunit n=1 Tax=Evansella tamaricis TaxID=2069301 RepID=A0ABS6JH46_9BACI|nr:efflux RND transporter periplasmic adaptor subunit [Evansella tamaricis]MBU9712554.1 efflux RND transporter periplasmic adaptor subunit [Evansella tamaricis]
MKKQNMNKIQLNNIFFTGTIFFLLTVLPACSLLPQEEEMLAPPLVEPASIDYDLVEVERGDIRRRVTGTGSFVPIQSENLFYEQAGGRLEGIYVAEGDLVEKGQILIEVDSGSLAYDVDQLEIELAKADIRLEQLRAQNADKYTIQIAELDKKGLELRLSQLQRQLDTSQITAPMDGIITFVTDQRPGDYVDAFQSLVQVADLSKLQLIYSAIAANDLADVKIGMEVNITMNGEDLEGEVVQTPDTIPDDVVNNNPDMYRRSIIINLHNAPDGINTGDSASIEIITAEKEDTLIIPKNGLRTGFGRNYVHVLVDNTRREIDIEPGIISATEVEVLRGLNEGDKVILK